MNNVNRRYQYDHQNNTHMYNNDNFFPEDDVMEYGENLMPSNMSYNNTSMRSKDYGPRPFVIDINEATTENQYFRSALWTGKHLQVTLMSIEPGEDVGLEVHPNLDQFIRIEQGEGLTKIGDRRDNLDFQARVYDDFVIIIPAGKWHNLINTGYEPLKLYSIYAPPEHPHGTVHRTKAEAEAAEEHHNH